MTTKLELARASSELSAEVATADGICARMADLQRLMSGTETSLDELKNRGFFKRIFANNTADLARAAGNVVQIQQATLTVISEMLRIHSRDLRMLSLIRTQMVSLAEGLGRVGSATSDQAELQVAMTSTLGQLALIVDQHITAAEREADFERRWVARDAELERHWDRQERRLEEMESALEHRLAATFRHRTSHALLWLSVLVLGGATVWLALGGTR